MHPWLDRLIGWNLVISKGKAKGKIYSVNPDLLRKLEFKGSTTLKGIEKHRLQELILRDLEIYREGSISEIHDRIGREIPRRRLQNTLRKLVESGEIGKRGTLKHTRYLYTR